MQKPFEILKDSGNDKINDLFTILFQNMQDKQFRVLQNATKVQIEKMTVNNEVLFNALGGNLFLCINVNGKIYQIQAAVMP